MSSSLQAYTFKIDLGIAAGRQMVAAAQKIEDGACRPLKDIATAHENGRAFTFMKVGMRRLCEAEETKRNSSFLH